MPKKLTIKEVAEQEGFEDDYVLLQEFGMESVVPACCSEGCQVEPDGTCEHGYPSVMIEIGVI